MKKVIEKITETINQLIQISEKYGFAIDPSFNEETGELEEYFQIPVERPYRRKSLEKREKAFLEFLHRPKTKLIREIDYIVNKLNEARLFIEKGKYEEGFLSFIEAMDGYIEFKIKFPELEKVIQKGYQKKGKSKLRAEVKAEVIKFIQDAILKVRRKNKRGEWTWNHKDILRQVQEKLTDIYKINISDRSLKKLFPRKMFK